jgi:acetyl-CoA carboxylase carboxyl transferase subunit alpha
MELAEKFKRPIITLIDTPGAYPGIGAEERGQGEAIASNLMQMSRLRVPIIAIVIGEGGSGGALALSVADRLYMLEHSVYSVISPEGCAAILWKKGNDLGPEDFARASEALKMTAQDLYRFKIIDEIILEPSGGAHRDPEETAKNIFHKIIEAMDDLRAKTPGKLIEDRYRRLKKIGSFTEEAEATAE